MTAERQPTAGSARRRRFFLLITLSLPVLFFLLLEAGLRLGGYGHSYPLFIPVSGAPGYLQANPEVVRRFVVDEAHAPEVEILPLPFPAQKATGTLRLVVQGGSSAAGWPYGYGASPAGMLQQRLQASLPGRDIEVISTAMNAVNSYTLLDFADEIIALQPDAVVIYAGHNEYLGILGVGSAVSAGRTRPVVLAWLALRDLRILQLLRNTYLRLAAAEAPPLDAHGHPRGTLMRRIVGEPLIPLGAPLYRHGAAQFRANLSALLARYRDAGIPVFIGTLASNEQDLEPFASRLAPGTDAAVWQHAYDAGVEALQAGENARARRALEAAVAIDDGAALAHFRLGRLYEALGDPAAAREAYLRARDRDQLRFRAPQHFNAVIREVAGRHRARVVEVEARLRAEAGDGIIGRDLMLEHLHPNLRGYFLLADAYYRALLDSGIAGPVMTAVSETQAWQAVPVTLVDRLNARFQILRLTSDWPFPAQQAARFRIPRQPTRAERIAYQLFLDRIEWAQAMRQLLDHYRQEGDAAAAAGVAVVLADARRHDAALQYEAGLLALDTERHRDAVRLLRHALQHDPGRAAYRQALARACREEAGAACAQQDPGHVRAVDSRQPPAQRRAGGFDAAAGTGQD
ncbi:MAG: SGNH/GDSL hydrolase family protein [Gammaproteobacteria bacterium]|jgi:lysophospholipase L1-like esterase